jgi:predicted transcriptional regulator
MGAALGTLTEIRELKSEITELRTDLKRFIERANQQHVESVLGDLKKDYAGLFTGHQIETAKADLSAHMIGDCKMREKCYGVFMDFLQNTSQHIKDGNVSEEIIQAYREQLSEKQSKGPFDRCDTCFTEVHRLFEKQVDLMQSLGIYQKNAEEQGGGAELADESVVKDLLEPVASVQRFQIMKALAVQTRTFSDISQMTGLRGGNLLFHIKKLTESGMILQRHERGDYIITDKGFKTMTAVSELSRRVGGN